MDREEWIEEARRGFGPPPQCRGSSNLWITGREGRCSRAADPVNRRTDTRIAKTPHIRQIRYEGQRWESTDYSSISAQDYAR